VLKDADVVAFVPTRDPKKARAFYEDVLGLQFISEDPFALVFNANGVMIRIANVSSVSDFKPASFTILGWHVPSAEAAVSELEAKGVTIERFPWMEQSEKGIWTSPGGAKIAWFKDPDGNVLSVTEI
jgi:catechol 2,3-dioxygenase-like lactoylglutathione lyase family enzyme